MRLNICFINKIQPVFITHLIPEFLLRVMACPHGIEIITFHFPDIFHYSSFVNNMPCYFVVLMHINPFNMYCNTINQQL